MSGPSPQRAARPLTARGPSPMAAPDDGAEPGPAAVPARRRRGPRAERHAGVRRRELERDRDRLDVRRPRHMQEVQGADRVGRRAGGAVDPRAFTADELREGWRLACRARRASDLVVEVPPLQTRPKAALAGVGRHVILRPAVQKRHLVLEEPTMEDQRSDLQRVLDALDDLEPHASIEVLRTLGGGAACADFDVTAVVVRPGADRARAGRHDVAALRDRVRPRDDDGGRHAARSGERPAGGGALDAQPPAAVRRRRDHAHLGDDDGLPTRWRRCSERAHETLASWSQRLRRGRGRAARGVRDHRVRQRDDDAPGAGIDPEPLSMAPFVVSTHSFAERARARTSGSRCTRGPRRSCSRRSAPTWAATSSPACWPPA